MKLAFLLATVWLPLQTPEPQQAVTVRVEPAAAEIAVDTRQALRAEVTLADDGAVVDPPIRWVSTVPEVASVDSTGTVVGLRPGAARVYAIYGNQGVGFAEVTVPQLPPARIPLGALPLERRNLAMRERLVSRVRAVVGELGIEPGME